ncbi:MAG: hypothetical protein IPP47_09400 [Bryobacterales bacterium]|nr:hypothetical protein [Bryobacterales bacterium]
MVFAEDRLPSGKVNDRTKAIAKLPTSDIKAKKEMLNRYKNFAPDVKSLKTVIPKS